MSKVLYDIFTLSSGRTDFIISACLHKATF